MGTTNFRNGFPGGVTLRGIQVFVSSALGKIAGGKVFFVSSVTGSNGNAGTDTTKPFATLAKAVSLCRANKGDVIYLMAKHAETVATAAGIDINIAGITVIGLGEGADRPTFTFSDTASTITVTAASTTIKNIITTPSVDSVVSPIVVSAADVTLDYEHRDASATVEAVRALLTTAAADRLNIRLKYLGFVAGNACVNAIRLVGGDNVTVDVDFHGVASTGVVEFITTASTNVTINGYTFNSGTTDGSKNVINTGGLGCTWFAVIDDGAAGARFTGGSASALASDDVSAIASALLVPTADVGTNVNERDVIGNKTDAGVQAVTTTKSLMAYLKAVLDILAGTAGITTWKTAAAPADGISISEAIRYMAENQGWRLVSKAYADLTGYDTAAAFTVTGDVAVRVVGVVGAVAITTTSGTTTLAVGTTELSTAIIAASTMDNTQFAATDVWVDSTPANDCEAMAAASEHIIGGGADIILTRNVDDITAGSLTLYCWWKPISSDGAVVAA